MSRRSVVLAAVVLISACSSADVFVPDQPPSSAAVVRIEITSAATLVIGDTATALATAYDEDGSAVGLVSFTWSTADSTVATVTPREATVRAVSIGVTSLQVRVGGVASTPFAINVVEPEPPEGVGDPLG